MKRVKPPMYSLILNKTVDEKFEKKIKLHDHLGGFDKELRNPILDILFDYYGVETALWHNVIDERLKKVYPDLKFAVGLQLKKNFNTCLSKMFKMYPQE